MKFQDSVTALEKFLLLWYAFYIAYKKVGVTMKRKIIIIISIFVLLAVAIASAYALDMCRMKNNKPVIFSTWGYDYTPPEEVELSEYENSFVGTVLEETTTYMIVAPVEDKADFDMGDKVKVEYGTDHIDYLYGKGRMVVIYFDGKPQKAEDGTIIIKSDDISTEGFREFELVTEPSKEKEKKLILSSDDINGFTSFGHISDTNLYYYGLDKVMITIKGFTMPLETALEKGRITLHGLIIKANQDVMDGVIPEIIYKDGGSQVYKYPNYTIIKYHTISGNRDIYIGSSDMDIQIANK